MQTQMGQIATMLTSVTRTRSPLQKELDSLTKVLAVIAWSAVAFIFVVGPGPGDPGQAAAAARDRHGHLRHPDGPARLRLRAALHGGEAARRGQGDREEPDRRRDARRDECHQQRQDRHAHDEPDDGVGHLRRRLVVHGRGRGLPQDRRDHAPWPAPRSPDFTRLALGLCLDSDATVDDAGNVVGDPTEAALVVLAARLGVDAEETRRAYPRLAEVPFDSEYKFMATFHEVTRRRHGATWSNS